MVNMRPTRKRSYVGPNQTLRIKLDKRRHLKMHTPLHVSTACVFVARM